MINRTRADSNIEGQRIALALIREEDLLASSKRANSNIEGQRIAPALIREEDLLAKPPRVKRIQHNDSTGVYVETVGQSTSCSRRVRYTTVGRRRRSSGGYHPRVVVSCRSNRLTRATPTCVRMGGSTIT